MKIAAGPPPDSADALVFFVGQQVDRIEILNDVDRLCFAHTANQCLGDTAAGGVAVRVNHTGVAVPAFQRGIDLAVNPVKIGPPLI